MNTNHHLNHGNFYGSHPANHNTNMVNQGPAPEPIKAFIRPPWHLQLVTYGTKAAFQMETSISKDGWHTILVESASKEDPNNPANLRYLWKNKTPIQIGRAELPLFVGVFLGLLPSVKFDNHGDNLKYLEIVNQNKNFFIKSGGKGLPLHVAPMPLAEAYMYGSMGLTQYARNFDGLTSDAALNIITRLCNQLYSCGNYKQATPRS